MTCMVTGARQYSSDLPQGSLEIPCHLTFSTSAKEIGKIKKVLSLVPSHTGAAVIAINIKAATASNPGQSSMVIDPLTSSA